MTNKYLQDAKTSGRLTTYSTISAELALLSDQRLSELLEKSEKVDTSTGVAMSLNIAGIPIFVKKMCLTDLERQSENIMSTSNLFNLPTYCQYGIAGSVVSPGFGVWREIAANAMTTNWVLTGQCLSFPLMYHWRILPRAIPELPTVEKLSEIERDVEFWEGAVTVRTRLLANLKASADVVLFLEAIPENLHEWLRKQIVMGGTVAESACTMVESNLKAITSFMNSRGLLHFDAHFENILTDGCCLYFADFGLSISNQFELSEAELNFFKSNHNYDKCYTMGLLVKWILIELFGAENYDGIVREYAAGKGNKILAPEIAKIITRYAPIAVLRDEFYRNFKESKTTSYPSSELERLLGERS